MSQPPYPPQGGNESGGEQPGSTGREPAAGADDPTRQIGPPSTGAQRDQTQQFGQPDPYGQPQYGQQPPYGQPQYGQQPNQPPYGQPQYGQPEHGQPQYGQQPGQPYGQPQYGQPQYGQQPGQPYGQPWGAPGGPGGPAPKSSKNTVVALVVAAVLVLAAIGAGLFFLLRGSDADPEAAAVTSSSSAADGTTSESIEPSPSPEAGGIPPATVPPDGLGDDPALDQLAQDCYDGDMQACDDLYAESEADSLYELYGGTCAGRQDVSVSDTEFCTNTFPEE